MNHHTEPWMDAYLDGELKNGQLRKAEAHLAACPECRAEIDRRRALSSLLLSVPAAAPAKSAERFAADVGLQMQRRTLQKPRSAWQKTAWHLLPLALLASLVFIEALVLLSNVLMLVPGLEAGLSAASPLQGWLQLPAPFSDLLSLLGLVAPLRWNWITALVAPIAIGLLYLSWLAGWWVMQKNTNTDLG